MREVEGRSNTAVSQFQSWCGSEDSGSLAGDEHDSVFVTVLENVPIAAQDSQAHVAFDEVPTFVAVGYDVLPVDWIGLVVGGFHDGFVHGLVRVGVVVGVVSGDYADGGCRGRLAGSRFWCRSFVLLGWLRLFYVDISSIARLDKYTKQDTSTQKAPPKRRGHKPKLSIHAQSNLDRDDQQRDYEGADRHDAERAAKREQPSAERVDAEHDCGCHPTESDGGKRHEQNILDMHFFSPFGFLFV